MNLEKLLLCADLAAIKANPSRLISAVTAIGPVVKAIKAGAKKQSAWLPALQ